LLNCLRIFPGLAWSDRKKIDWDNAAVVDVYYCCVYVSNCYCSNQHCDVYSHGNDDVMVDNADAGIVAVDNVAIFMVDHYCYKNKWNKYCLWRRLARIICVANLSSCIVGVVGDVVILSSALDKYENSV
jgi:hypothetical protein